MLRVRVNVFEWGYASMRREGKEVGEGEGDVSFCRLQNTRKASRKVCGGGTGNGKKRKRKGGMGGRTLSMQQTEHKCSMRIRNVR